MISKPIGTSRIRSIGATKAPFSNNCASKALTAGKRNKLDVLMKLWELRHLLLSAPECISVRLWFKRHRCCSPFCCSSWYRRFLTWELEHLELSNFFLSLWGPPRCLWGSPRCFWDDPSGLLSWLQSPKIQGHLSRANISMIYYIMVGGLSLALASACGWSTSPTNQHPPHFPSRPIIPFFLFQFC